MSKLRDWACRASYGKLFVIYVTLSAATFFFSLFLYIPLGALGVEINLGPLATGFWGLATVICGLTPAFLVLVVLKASRPSAPGKAPPPET